MLVFYRGYHCPICRKYLHDLEVYMPEFRQRGVNPIALSCDVQARAQMARDEWFLPHVPIAYALPPETARSWGLYLSRGKTAFEPALFNEPGIFLLRPDRTLYATFVQSIAMMRPAFDDMLRALDVIIREDYPIHGEA